MKRKIETDNYLEEIREMEYWRLLEKASVRVQNMGYEMDTLIRSVVYHGLSPQSGFWKDRGMLHKCQEPEYFGQWSSEYAQRLGTYINQSFGNQDGSPLTSCVPVSKCTDRIDCDIIAISQDLEYNLPRATSGMWAYGVSKGYDSYSEL